MKLAIQEDACGLARKLIADGLDPSEVLEFYRGNVLCLRGRADAFAKVRVREDAQRGPKFERWKPPPPEWKARRRADVQVKDALNPSTPSPDA